MKMRIHLRILVLFAVGIWNCKQNPSGSKPTRDGVNKSHDDHIKEENIDGGRLEKLASASYTLEVTAEICLASIDAEIKESSNGNIFQYVICRQDACDPSYEKPGSFAIGPYLHTKPLSAPSHIYVRNCHSETEACSDWSEASFIEPSDCPFASELEADNQNLEGNLAKVRKLPNLNQDHSKESIEKLLLEYSELHEENKEICEVLLNLHAASGLKLTTEVAVKKITPELCSQIMLEEQNIIFDAIDRSQGGMVASKEDLIFVAVLGSAAVISLVLSGYGYYKLMKTGKHDFPEVPNDLNDPNGHKQTSHKKAVSSLEKPETIRTTGEVSQGLRRPSPLANDIEKSRQVSADAPDKINSAPTNSHNRYRNLAIGGSIAGAMAGIAAIGILIYSVQSDSSKHYKSEDGILLTSNQTQLTQKLKANVSRMRDITAKINTIEQKYQNKATEYKLDGVKVASKNDDITVVVTGDTQIYWGRRDQWANSQEKQDEGIKTNQETVYAIHRLSEIGHKLKEPEAVIINGDLTAFGHADQWNVWRQIYDISYKKRASQVLKYPLYPGLGNHDYANNIDDCWGSWTSIFGAKANWCAKNSIKFIPHFLQKTQKKLFGYHKGSKSYSWVMGRYHFVQMHNYPEYEEKKIGIVSSLGWLEKELIEAKKRGLISILNFHDLEDNRCLKKHCGTKSNPSKFQNIVAKGKVGAIFIGHFHNAFGQVREPLLAGEQKIPVFNTSAPGYNQFLALRLRPSYFEVMRISSAGAVPKFLGKEVIEQF